MKLICRKTMRKMQLNNPMLRKMQLNNSMLKKNYQTILQLHSLNKTIRNLDMQIGLQLKDDLNKQLGIPN